MKFQNGPESYIPTGSGVASVDWQPGHNPDCRTEGEASCLYYSLIPRLNLLGIL